MSVDATSTSCPPAWRKSPRGGEQETRRRREATAQAVALRLRPNDKIKDAEVAATLAKQVRGPSLTGGRPAPQCLAGGR